MNTISPSLVREPPEFPDALSKSMDAALELRIRQIIDQMHDACVLTDEKGKFLHVNEASTALLGFSTHELLQLTVPQTVFRPERHSELWKKFTKSGYQSGTIEFVKKNGDTFHCYYNAWSHIIPGRHSVLLQDISEQRRLQENSRENANQFRLEQQRFSEMFLQSPVAMCILKGPDYRFEKTNSLFDTLIGRTDLIGKPVRQAFPELEGQEWFELLDMVFHTGETTSGNERLMWILDIKKGGWKPLYLNYMLQPFRNAQSEVEGVFCFAVDITEQVVSRKKIEESERRYRQIVETAQEGIWLLDKNHETLFVNRKMGDILGYDPEEMVGQNILHFVDNADGAKQMFGARAAMTSSSFEMRFVSKSGKLVWGLLNTARMTEFNGDYKGLLAMVTDVTERKTADEELKKLSLIARSTTHAIIITNPAGRIEWVNEAFTRITGFEYLEVIGKTNAVLYGPDTDKSTEVFINGKIVNREPYVCEILKYTKNGAPIWVEIQARPVFDNENNLTYYFNLETDISERKQAYQKLLKTENQVRIFARQLNNMLEDERSRLAREIHDEFGQQLMGLKMSLSYLEKLQDLPAEAGGVIRELLSGVESSFHSLRNFSTELRPGILDTLGLIPSIEWLARGFEKKSGIRCRVEIDTRQQVFHKDVSINYFRICQEALTNILKHAESTDVTIRVVQDSDSLSMEIADNGKGMLYEKVENPFSLGLLGMRERARLIGGDLEIFSGPGHGTRIQLRAKIYG